MRMDEYQKWLEAQFMDNEVEEVDSAVAVVHELIGDDPAQHAELVAVGAPEPNTAAALDEPSSPALPLSVTTEETESSPAAVAQAGAPILPKPIVPAIPPSSSTHKWAGEDEVPSIEDYLPFLRAKMPEPLLEKSSTEETAAGDVVEPIEAESDSVIAESETVTSASVRGALPFDGPAPFRSAGFS